MKKVTLPILLLLLFSLHLFAQELTWKRFTVNDGLVQSQVNAIFQDSKGYLWISTRLGISRFDGIHFENFTEKDGLLSSWAHQIVEDDQGYIWIVFTNGLTRYDGHSFDSFVYPNQIEIASYTLVSLSPDSLVMYQLLKSNTLREVFISKGQFTIGKQVQLPPAAAEPIGHLSLKYDQVLKTLWFTDFIGDLYCYKAGVLQKQDFVRIQGFQSGPDGKLYYIDDGSLYWVENDRTQLILRDAFRDADKNARLGIAVDKTGNILVYESFKKQATLISAVTLQVTKIKFPQADNHFFDQEGNLWISTENGLYFTNSLSIINFLPEKGGMNPNIWNITEEKNGDIFFGSYFDGLQRFNNGKFTLEKTLPTLPNGTQTFLAMGSLVDAAHNIYLTTQHYPMIKYDGQKFTVFPKINKPIASFIIRQNRNDSSIMIGAHHYYLKVNKDQTFDSLRVQPGNGKSAVVTGIEADKFNRIWLGGFNGMSLLIGDSLIHLPTAEFPFEFGGNTLLRDHKDNIWIGNKSGLYLYDYQNFEKIEDPLLNDLVLSLMPLGDTMLFIGTIKGIIAFDMKSYYANKTIQLMAIGEDKGFVGIEPGQNGFFKDSKGYLWLPNNDRVVRIDPGQVKKNPYPPKVYITQIYLLGEKMNWLKHVQNNNGQQSFSFNSDEKNLKFEFIGISFRQPQGVTYSHQLEGYDAGWSPPSNERSAVYTNLPPGNYRFKVKAANADGVWSENEAMLQFTIVPKLYQKLWFLIAFGLLAAFLMLALGAYVMSIKRKKQQKQLEDDYKLSELRLLGIQNQIEPHFTYNAINTIAAAVLKEEKNIAYSYFVKLSQLMRTILQTNNQLITTVEGELTFVTNYLQIQQLRFNNSFDFIIEVGDDVQLQTVIPKMCIQTFAENAVKHGLLPKTEKGRLIISIFNEDDFLCINVFDDGIGRERAQALKTNGSTNGLKIMKGYFEHFNLLNSKKLNWQIVDEYSADNQPGGTKVYVKIPRGFIYTKK